MSEVNSSKKHTKNTSMSTESASELLSASISLINPNETLVKKEEKSVVVRNKDGKLVRRTSPDGALKSVYALILEGEVFIREEESRIIVRNKDGKLVARKKQIKPESDKAVKTKNEVKKQEIVDFTDEVTTKQTNNLNQETTNEQKETGSTNLKSRLLAKHAFLGRMERGEKVSAVSGQVNAERPMQSINDDLYEEIEDSELEAIEPDAEVTALENAITEDKFNRTIGKSSSKAMRSGEKDTFISGGAINPNEKPSLKGTASGDGLVGNYVLAKPEVVDAPEKQERKKKARKPLKPWVVAVVLVGIYVAIMLAYFFAGYNFGKKQVNIVLYYIDISDDAKLEYYDGEQFVYGGMEMTYYYSDDHIESFTINGSHFGETTQSMGYTINGSTINALWIDSFSSLSERRVKIKFIIDNLVCYVPVTIHRNKLKSAIKHFELTSLESGQVIEPTIFGVYSNKLLEQKNETIEKELHSSQFNLVLSYEGEEYNLKSYNCYDGEKFTLPAKCGEVDIDYNSPTLSLKAVIPSDGYNAQQSVILYN